MSVNPVSERSDTLPAAEPIRLTGTSFAVLSLLDVLGPSSPYDLKQALEKSVENFWPVPHTTFYAEPTRLARGGFLSERQEAGGRRRKLYSLTDAGREALRWGVNDLGGTLMEESISRLAGSYHGTRLEPEQLIAAAHGAGRPAAERTTLYELRRRYELPLAA